MNLAEVVRRCGRRFGDRPAFVADTGERLTFADLDLASDRLASALAHDAGIAAGDVVALRLPSDFSYVVAYAALSKLGAAASGINPGLMATEADRILARLAPTAVLTPHDIEALAAIGAGATNAAVPVVDHDPDRLAAIVFTSGTTGTPKGAMFRDRHLEAIARADTGSGLDRATRGSAPPPNAQLASTQFAHVGFMTKLPWYLSRGMTTHLLTRWRADDVVRLIARERLTTLGAIAPQVALILRSELLTELDCTSLALVIAGGAASPPSLIRAAVGSLGVTYSVRYSSTESGGVGLSHDTGPAQLAHGDDGIDTVGRPRPGVTIRIDDDELCLRSPTMFDGYWNDPTATEATLVDGWLRTGDLAELDEQGRVRLVGRRSHMYIRGGYNVAPAEVEAVLVEHPDISEAVVVPRADPVMGEIGVAVIVPRDPRRTPSLEDLRRHASSRLARWKLPEALTVLDRLPLNSVSKPDLHALRELVSGVPRDEQG